MGEWNRGQVSIQLQDGTEIFDFLSFVLSDKYTDPLGSYTFVIRPRRQDILSLNDKLTKGSLIGVTINGSPQGSFLIQTKKTRIVKDVGVEFTLTCHTVLITPHQGSVDPDIAESFQSDTPVSDVILLALGPFGFDTILADNTANVQALTGKSISGRGANPVVQEIKHKEAKAHEGESAYGFCARIFSRLGLALRVNFEGVLLLGSPDYDQQPLYQVEQSSALTREGDAVIGDVNITDTNNNQFSEVVIRGTAKDTKGQKRATRPIHRLRVAGFEDPSGEVPFSDAPSSEIPAGRHSYRSDAGAIYKPSFKLDKFSRDNDFCKERAHRQIGRQAESGYVIEVEVDGLIATSGAIWTVDTIARVKIEKAGIDDDMWLMAVEKRMDRNSAQSTKLTLIPKNSLILGVT